MKNKNSFNEILKKYLNIKSSNKIITKKVFGNHLANEVYMINIDNDNYILKKYNYDYNFNLSNRLYKIYEKNNINCIKPINKNIINVDGIKYNIFNYLNYSKGQIDDNFISNLISIDRKVNFKPNLIDKCDLYYYYLNNLKKLSIHEEKIVLKIYNSIKFDNIFQAQYINHGDISISNLLFQDNIPYLIDFDEAVVTTELYDFAVISVKLKTKGNKFKHEEIRQLINKLDLNYTIEEYKKSIKMYLCKILLEKFYLHEIGSINLFDNKQKKDDYKRYIILLDDINNI